NWDIFVMNADGSEQRPLPLKCPGAAGSGAAPPCPAGGIGLSGRLHPLWSEETPGFRQRPSCAIRRGASFSLDA
ncbi:MAG: hypothetical protein KC441_16330, partial [Anaerolineales bacterium]|nr:hypothetical protein [Anaerolineales bacterium]